MPPKAQKKPSDGSILQGLRLLDVRLRKIYIEARDDIYESESKSLEEFSYDLLYSRGKKQEPYDFSVILSARIRGSAKKGNEPDFYADLEIEGLYSSEENVTKKNFQDMKKSIFIIHLWPYLRELIHNATMRAGLDALIIPPIGAIDDK